MDHELTSQSEIVRDDSGVVRRLSHARSPYQVSNFVPANASSLATRYLEQIGKEYGIEPDWLSPTEDGALNSLRFANIKSGREADVVSYQQIHAGIPVFRAGVSVIVRRDLSCVVGSQSTLHLDIDLDAEQLRRAQQEPQKITSAALQKRLNLGTKGKRPKIEKTQAVIYRYSPKLRFDPATNEEDQPPSSPRLDLPDVPEGFLSGKHFLVNDVVFSLDLPGWGLLEWQALIEIESGAVLYLRAGVESCTGAVFRDDPITISGNASNDACAGAASLDPLAEVVTLQGLTSADPQPLSGEYVQLSDTDPPSVTAPTAALPACEFLFSAASDDFAAVNAYHHLDALYRMVDEMGFVNYFAGTTFPIPVDPRGENGAVNAHHHGTGSTTTKFRFGLAQSGCAVGIACDRRVVIHEFGHSVLRNHIDSGLFSFAHGVGDSMAVILSDPRSQAPDRFETFPFNGISRRHDRDVASGWGWTGTNDTGGYASTQILSTTLFRAYRSLGGDSGVLTEREFAARMVTYLILAAVESETPLTAPSSPEDYSEDLINADLATAIFEGHPGGAFHKVIRWAFEKQDGYGGRPPKVDVYIDDGRGGEYEWLDDFTSTPDVWTRSNPDNGTVHQPPLVGSPAYAYVRVQNRGSQAATDIKVSAYSGQAGGNAVWPDEFTPLPTPELSIPGPLLPGASVVVGPFEWTPATTEEASIIMSTSTTQDPSNSDIVAGSLPTRRLVPHDNNIAQREIKVVPYPAKYSVKFICGSPCADSCCGGPVAPGSYFTAINILNPTEKETRFRTKVAVALPGECPGQVTEFTFTDLGPCQALEIDCCDIFKKVGLPGGGFLKGFVIIESVVELDVVAVYSAAGADGQVETLEIDRIVPRLAPDPTPPDCPPTHEPKLPDLIPVPAFPPPPPNEPYKLPQNFCYSTVGDFRADAIRVIVRNQGVGNAPSSFTEIGFGGNPPIQVPTPAINAGSETTIEAKIPEECFKGESTCNFRITVNATTAFVESDTTNNQTSGSCPGSLG